MPTTEVTVDELFEKAIAAEHLAKRLYLRLVDMFAHEPEIAEFWQRYADEELGHAKWLARLRERLPSDVLSAPADPETMAAAERAQRFSVDHLVKDVQNLEEAYQLVNELESSETNAVFEFLITNFASDNETREFLRAQLQDHVSRLMFDFPEEFKSAALRERVSVHSTS
jgi:rubrerythrin